jgi:hypothetical protein
MRLARPPHARAQASIILGAALSCAASCLPSRDLNDYSSTRREPIDDNPTGEIASPSTGTGGALPSPAAPAPGDLDSGGTGGASAGAGAGGTGGDAPGLSLPDASTAPTPADAAPPPACAVDELEGPNGHCYFFDARTVSWLVARIACLARGTGWDLASVRSAADTTFLADQLAFEAWIGASDVGSEGTWVWVVDGQSFWLGDGATGGAIAGAYVNWSSTEPNGGANSDCARAVPLPSGTPSPDARWADLECNQPRGAICEAFAAP